MATDNDSTISELRSLARNFVTDRDWIKYHNPKNLSMSIAIEAAELMEHFQFTNSDDTIDASTKAKSSTELADVVLYCLSMADALDIDLSDAIVKKVERNSEKYPVDQVKGNYVKYSELKRE